MVIITYQQPVVCPITSQQKNGIFHWSRSVARWFHVRWPSAVSNEIRSAHTSPSYQLYLPIALPTSVQFSFIPDNDHSLHAHHHYPSKLIHSSSSRIRTLRNYYFINQWTVKRLWKTSSTMLFHVAKYVCAHIESISTARQRTLYNLPDTAQASCLPSIIFTSRATLTVFPLAIFYSCFTITAPYVITL